MKHWDKIKILFISIFIFSCLIQSLIGIFQVYSLFGFSSGYYPITGTFANPNHFSGYIVSMLPFTIGIYLLGGKEKNRNKTLRITSLIFIISALLALPHAKTRGDWLAGAVGTGIIFINYYDISAKVKRLLNNALRKTLAIIGTIIILFSLLYALYCIRPASAEGRLLIWKITTGMISENPLLGKGFGSFGARYNNYQAEYFKSGKGTEREKYLADNVNYAHNEYLQIWAEFGLLGLSLFLFIIYYILNYKNETNDHGNYLLSAKASIVTICVTAFFSFPFHIIPTLLNFIFFIILAAYRKKALSKILINKNVKTAVSITAIAIVALSLNYFIEKYQYTKEWREAMRYSKYGNYGKAINIFKSLKSHLNNEPDFLFNYGAVLSLAGKHIQAIQMLEKSKKYSSASNLFVSLGNSYAAMGNISEAEKNYYHASFIVPIRLYPKYMLAKMYKENNKIAQSKKIALEILSSRAKFPSTAEKQIKKEMENIIKL